MDEQAQPTSWSDADPIQFDQLLGTLWDTLRGWLDVAVQMLPNIVLATLLLVVTWLVAGRFATLASRGLKRVSSNRQVNSLLTVALKVGIIVGGLFAALALLNLDGVVTSLLAGVGVVGIALGFAFQDIASNFMASVLMAISRPFTVGDLIQTGDFFGKVEKTDLRSTHLRKPDGELVLIPNRDVYNSALTNLTETPDRRVEIEVGVGYDDDLRRARDILVEALEGVEAIDEGRPVEVYCTGFGDSSIGLMGRFWICTGSQAVFLKARSDAFIAVKEALDDNGMNIPFPIRTLDFGSEPVGGERLDSVLRPVFAQDG